MKDIKKIVLGGFFLALGIVMPFLTMQVPQIGSKLLPMHLPVLICGFVLGWKYGLLVGFVTPLLRTFMFGMPPMMTAIGMAFELATYGAITGILYKKLPKSKVKVWVSLIAAMVVGRVVWGLVSIVLYGINQTAFTWQIFMGGAVLNAIPGIILQLVIVPVIIIALEKSGVMRE